jgi:hypothetical protein
VTNVANGLACIVVPVGSVNATAVVDVDVIISVSKFASVRVTEAV